MSFNKASCIPFEEKVKAVEKYLRTEQPLRKIANALGVSHPTLWFWVKQYKKGGKDNLRKRNLFKKKLSKEVEKKVMLLKEHDPSLSIRKAKRLMNNDGIQISNKGIWGIWKRYGFVGRGKQLSHHPPGLFIHSTPELDCAIEMAKEFVAKEDYRGAVKILNNLPCLPECQLLLRIPKKFLSLRRKLEYLYLEYEQITPQQFSRKARMIGKSLEKKGYIYSSIIADFFELDALGWLERSEQKIEVFDRLERKMQGIKDSALWFFFYFEQISNYAHLLRVNELLKVTQKCRRFIYHLPYSPYWEYFGSILTYVGKYKAACSFYKRAFEQEKNKVIVERLILKLAISGYGMAGEYPECKKMLSKAKATKNRVHLAAINSLANAHLSFGQGNLTEASKFFLEPLGTVSRAKPLNNIYAASIGLASVAMALNNKAEAKIYLKKYLPLMKKYKHVREQLTLGCLLGSVEYISDERLQIQPLCLLNLLLQVNRTMRIGDYRKAFRFAQRKGLLGLFHRWIIFFPEPILRLLEKGKKTGLPRAILNFPVFNQKIPVYHIKLLGKLVVTKNQEYLKARLSPKEKTFLIHLALRAGAPRKFILLKNLYENFWSHSRNPSSLLLHLLVRLKKKLRLSGYLLYISSKAGEPRLINRGVYFTSNFGEFETLFVQAKALERAEEWGFAKKEYLRAFALFRGEPFRKMYDPWSEHMRRVILNKLENTTLEFAKKCLAHRKERDAKKVLEKILKIIPQSEEIRKMVGEYESDGVSEKR